MLIIAKVLQSITSTERAGNERYKFIMITVIRIPV